MVDPINALLDLVALCLDVLEKVRKHDDRMCVLAFLDAVEAVKLLCMVRTLFIHADVGHSVDGVAAARRRVLRPLGQGCNRRLLDRLNHLSQI